MNRKARRRYIAYGRQEPTPREPGPLYAVYRLPSTSSEGYAFVVLMIAITVMLIALAAALPSVYHESQREKEEELIFRGNEYAQAIYRFQLQIKRYPKSVDELIRTNNIRFLRHAYKDPMSPNGKWRFIHVAPNGMLIDSLTMGPQVQTQLIGASGQSPPDSSQSSLGSSSQSSFGSSSQSSFGSSSQSSSFGSSSQSSFGSSSQSSSISGGSNEGEPGNQDAQKDAKKEKIRAACKGGKSESAFFFPDNQSVGTLIGGVASCSNKTSIRVWNKKTNYEEWEFLGIAFQPAGFPGLQQQPQPQPGAGGQPTQPGQGVGVGQGGGVGGRGLGPTPPGAQQPDAPLTDQPAPEEPEAPDNPPQ